MVEHALGPWRLDDPEDNGVTDDLYHCIAVGPIGTPFNMTGYIPVEAARLMWAAPDLLAALRGMVDITINPDDGGVFEDGEVPALDAARAAIAKAVGGE